MANYFTDIVGGTREAFQRGYENVGNIRRDIGEQQAARALARGDTRAAKQAYGRAGMAEQVDVLGQREAAQAEAMRKRQEDMAEAERKRTIEEQDRAARQTEAQYKNAAAQFTALGGYSNALLEVPYEKRKEVWQTILRPAVASMGMPQEALTQMDAADFSDDNLRLFARAMGDEKEKLKPQVSVGQQGAVVYDPKTGQARFVRAQGAPASDATERDKPPSGYRWTPSGDLEIIAGGPADKANAAPSLSQTDARNALKAFSSIKPFQSALENFRTIVAEAGPMAHMGVGPEAAKLKAAHTALAMQLKGEAALNLGALIGADFTVLYNMIGEPGNPGKFYAEGGRDGALAKLDEIGRFFTDREQALKEQYAPYAADPRIATYYKATPAAPRQGAFLLRPGAPGAPPQVPPSSSPGKRPRVISVEEQ